MMLVTKREELLGDALRAVENDDLVGFCTKCGAEKQNVEPDAQEYECDDCGERSVYGAQEILLMYAL